MSELGMKYNPKMYDQWTGGYTSPVSPLSFNVGDSSSFWDQMGDLPWGKIAAGAGAGVGLAGAVGTAFGSGYDLPIDKADIDKMINQMRSTGYTGIGQQLAGANVATAGNLASRGLGSSTITTGALGANQAAAMQAISQLESQLGVDRNRMLMQLAQMEAQRDQMKRQDQMSVWSNLADVGLMALFL